MTKSKIFFVIKSVKNISIVLFIFLEPLVTMFIASTHNSMFAYKFRSSDIPHKSAVCTSAFPLNMGSIFSNVSRHDNLDRPCPTASLILVTCHPFKHTCLPSADVISLYISIYHFACNGLTMDSFSGIL